MAKIRVHLQRACVCVCRSDFAQCDVCAFAVCIEAISLNAMCVCICSVCIEAISLTAMRVHLQYVFISGFAQYDVCALKLVHYCFMKGR